MTDALKLPFAGEDTVRRLSADLEEPKWLLEDRLDAYAKYAELPIETNNLFTLYVDLRAARWVELETYRETGDSPQVSEVVPEGAAALIEVAENKVVARAMSAETRAAGVVIDTFANVLRERPELLRDVIEGGASLPTDDKFAQFARSHSALGLLIHVPRNVALEQPIVVRWTAGQPGKGLVSRTVISLGENASARILEEQVPTNSDALDGAAQSLWWGTAEVKLDRGANLSFAGQQDFGQQTLAIVNRHATLAQDAQLRWALASVGAELHKSRIDNRLVGRGSGVNQVEIGFGDGRQLFDLTSYTRHIGPDTTGDLLSKGVFLDRARGYFKGMIEIQRAAKGTDSFLGEFAMLMTKQARSVTIPSLEIDQPDVRRASHASSVGPIDETEIFYLMSRGLPRDVARKFIVMGFLEPVVARIPLPEAQDRLRRLLEQKWPDSPEQQAA
ncbi:MAG TPA: SufD family Fe-S cluster assembly protein [Candidatus Limnocylindrales bacterium]|nr:SufD family Fe-S cluster assembly protein [Candidatus Limnocylindrales bacterium]